MRVSFFMEDFGDEAKGRHADHGGKRRHEDVFHGGTTEFALGRQQGLLLVHRSFLSLCTDCWIGTSGGKVGSRCWFCQGTWDVGGLALPGVRVERPPALASLSGGDGAARDGRRGVTGTSRIHCAQGGFWVKITP